MAYALGLRHLGYEYAMADSIGNPLAMNEPKRNLTVMAHRLPVVLTALPDEKVMAAEMEKTRKQLEGRK